MTTFMTYKEECEALRQRVAELEKEHDAAWKEAVEHVEAQQNIINELNAERDELLAAAEAIEIDAEECLDFDECTAMLVPIDTYHKLMEAIASVKEK